MTNNIQEWKNKKYICRISHTHQFQFAGSATGSPHRHWNSARRKVRSLLSMGFPMRRHRLVNCAGVHLNRSPPGRVSVMQQTLVQIVHRAAGVLLRGPLRKVLQKIASTSMYGRLPGRWRDQNGQSWRGFMVAALPEDPDPAHKTSATSLPSKALSWSPLTRAS